MGAKLVHRYALPTGNLPETVRKGQVAPLVALLLIPLLAAVSFCVDIGYVTLNTAKLHAASDAAAIAAARALADNYGAYMCPGQTQKCSILRDTYAKSLTAATQAAQANGQANPLSNMTVSWGFTDNNGYHTEYDYPNSVTITLRQDLPLFFGPALGYNSWPLSQQSVGTLYGGSINDSLQPLKNVNVLPVAFSYDVYDEFMETGISSDGTYHTDSTGTYQLLLYPYMLPYQTTALSLDGISTSPNDFSNWLQSGATKDNITSLHSTGLLPLSTSVWQVFPLKAQLSALSVGKKALLPLYDTIQGTGQTTKVHICGFVGVQAVEVDVVGSNVSVYVQPASVLEPSAHYQTLSPATTPTAPAWVNTFYGAKLTR